MSKGGGSQTTTQNSVPWDVAQPHLAGIMGSAGQLYAQGLGNEAAPFSGVVPFSNQTEMGLQAIENRAMSGSPVADGARGWLTGAFDQANPGTQSLTNFAQGNFANQGAGAFANAANGSMDATSGAAGQGLTNLAQTGNTALPGASNATRGGLNVGGNDIWNTLGNSAFTRSNTDANMLRDTAAGEHLNGNPNLMAALERGAGNITDRVNSQFSMAGGYGRGAHQEMLTDDLGDFYGNALYQNYNNERNNQLNAQGQLAGFNEADINRDTGIYSTLLSQSASDRDRQLQGMGLEGSLSSGDLSRRQGAYSDLLGNTQNDMARRMQGLGGYSDTQESALNRMLQGSQALSGATSQDFQNKLSAAGMAPDLANSEYDDALKLLGVGAQREGKAGEDLADLQGRFDMQSQAPWQNLMKYLGAVNPLAGIGGTQTATGPKPQDNSMQQGLGTALMIASMFA